MIYSVILSLGCLNFLAFAQDNAQEPICPSAANDRKSANPICDPCSSQVYQENNDPRSIEIYEKYTAIHCESGLVGWTRFTQGSGKLSEKCTMMDTCGASYTNWLNGAHPTVKEGIVTREVCQHKTKGVCCTYRTNISVKNCGAYFVYRLVNLGTCNHAYCVVPAQEPDVCNDAKFTLKSDTDQTRGELSVQYQARNDFTTGNDNNWYQFTVGKGKIKENCPGYYHCNFRYPTWIDGPYPVNEGDIVHRMTQTAENEFCQVTQSQPLFIVKCGDKYYHKLTSPKPSYAGYCISEDTKDICNNAESLSENWRGTLQPKERAHCDTMALDFDGWYRLGSHNKKMPDSCVAPDMCGTASPYYVTGGHPKPGEGVVGRKMYYASKTDCTSSALNGYILNCGDAVQNDYIYHWYKPSGCDKAFCVEEEPCRHYTELSEQARSARSVVTEKLNDVNLPHGWYRFMNDKGVMPMSPTISGHSGITYPGWYNGEMPQNDQEEKTGKTCFRVNANTCSKSLPTTIKKCGDYYVYHLQNPANNYGYTVEQEVCTLPTLKLDQEYRLQWRRDNNQDDRALATGWYTVEVGNKMLATDSTMLKHGGATYPGWMYGDHPTEPEGIVERTVYFTTSETQYWANAHKIWVRDCGGYYMYYLKSPGSSYGYSVGQNICSASVPYIQVNDPSRLYTEMQQMTTRHDYNFFKGIGVYRFLNGKGRLVEEPRIQQYYHGSFYRNFYFPKGSHASVADGEISEEIQLPVFYDDNTNRRYMSWSWKIRIANCGNYYLYIIPTLLTSRTASGISVDNDEASVCRTSGYYTTTDQQRLVTTIGSVPSSDNVLVPAWYRLTAGLGHMPTTKFAGEQCSTYYHGVLDYDHPAKEDGVQQNNVCFTSTSASCSKNKMTWVLNCGTFYLYRLQPTAAANYRYCEAAEGCGNPRVITHPWRINGKKVTTGKYEATYFGSDGWVTFDIGLKRLPESPPPRNVGGCSYSGYIDSHPKVADGAVDRLMKFPDSDYTLKIQVQNCGNKYVYFLSGKGVTSNYCYVADSDVCDAGVYTVMDDERRLQYTYTGTTSIALDNYFEGWKRFTIGDGRLMEYPPTLTSSCSAKYPGWVNGTHPKPSEGIVTRQLCWKSTNDNTCFQSNDISIKNCGDYYVYGIVKKAASTYYGHCVAQTRKDVCDDAEILADKARGFLTPTTKILNDNTYFGEFKYYRFTTGLGRIVNFPVRGSFCGSNNYKILMKAVLEADKKTGDFVWQGGYFTTGWTGHYAYFIAMQCDGYVVYGLRAWNIATAGWCIEEDVCASHSIKTMSSPINLQWNKQSSGSTTHQLAHEWYEVTAGNKRIATTPSDMYDCGSTYPGYMRDPAPDTDDGIRENWICHRTSTTAVSTCYQIYVKQCPKKILYYLYKITSSASYSICIESDVCNIVTPADLDDTWRLNGNPPIGMGYDNIGLGWYRVNIGKKRLAENRVEATCGSSYGGWLALGRHPTKAEGTVYNYICYDPLHNDGKSPRACTYAQVVNCGGYYMYHLQPYSSPYGVCIATEDNPFCTDYTTLDEDWRNVEKYGDQSHTDNLLPSGWYRFAVGTGRMPTVCPDYSYGGGYYPAWAPDLTIPAVDEGLKKFTIYSRHPSYCTAWKTRYGYVKNCGEFPVYYLPNLNLNGHTYTVEADVCSEKYTIIDDVKRLSWQPTDNSVSHISDNTLHTAWYRFKGGFNKINEQCVPTWHGGTQYPGSMVGGHPAEIGEVVERKVYFRTGTNCYATSKTIRAKKCGGFYLYRLPPTLSNYGYTIASDPCKTTPNLMSDEDRSIYNKDTNYITDSSLPEGWYKITTGNGVMPKVAPPKDSCRNKYPIWLQGENPTVEEGVVSRKMCAFHTGTTNGECYWNKMINVRNCGKYMLYYFNGIPYSSSRICVEHTLLQTCASATLLDDKWRGSAYQSAPSKDDKNLPHGWYKFGAHTGRLANFPVSIGYCGSNQPLHMEGSHVKTKGTCETKRIYQSLSRTNLWARSTNIEECLCENGEYIYYHNHQAFISTSYKSTFCEEMDPCNNEERIYSSYRSAWNPTTVKTSQPDNGMEPNWVSLYYGSRKMPTFSPELQSCGLPYPGWYDGEMPGLAGEEKHGRTCFVTSATALCSSPVKTQVRKCANGKVVYHWLPTASTSYGYCIDQDVCGVPAEQWGKDHGSRLRYTSTSGFKSPVNDNSLIKKNWYTMTIGLKKMPEECVGYQSCGAQYPGWLQGLHPSRDEGLVERTVCFRSDTNCCAYTQQIKVIQCRNGYMYRLYPTTSSNRRYCIDENPDDICTMQVTDISDVRHGIGHYYDSLFQPDYKIYQPSWFRVAVHKNTFIHYPPPMYQCGTKYGGWVQDPAPDVNDGVVQSRACFRDSMSNELCYQATPFKMKNCNGEMRYMYVPPVAATRNMCVDEDICTAGTYKIYDNEVWRLAYSAANTDSTTWHHDYKKIPDGNYRGWFRFTNTGENRIVEIQQEYYACGAKYPGWLDGTHPSVKEGVVTRALQLTEGANYKKSTRSILVKNCGDFMLYNIDFNWESSRKWAICIDTDVCDAPVQTVTETHRLKNTWGLLKASCDNYLKRGWYRFGNGFEQMPENCPASDSCGAKEPGWLSQPHPTEAEGLVERKVCFADTDQCCPKSTDIMVKNCGTHYVYRLYEQSCNKKYCVDESANSMCQDYTEINDKWRGENVAYDSTEIHGDNTLQHGWYRFTKELGKMPEYCMSFKGCGVNYPGYLNTAHPKKEDGIINAKVCFSTSLTNCGQSCIAARVRNCGQFYVYELIPTTSVSYGYCVAQDQCDKAIELDERWRLSLNPSVQTTQNDHLLRKGWYRMVEGSGKFPNYKPDKYYGGAYYPSYLEDPVPSVKDGIVDAVLKYSGSTSTTNIKVKNCTEHIIYWLQSTPNTYHTISIDQDICLHAKALDEDWRNIFNVVDDDERHTDYKKGKDWYQFTTGFKQMAEDAPSERNSCGTRYAGYLRERHPRVDEGILVREVCFRDDAEWWSNHCWKREDIKVKNCGDMYAYQMDPKIDGAAYCAYNRKSSCVPKVIHAKYGSSALINCSLSTDENFDAREVEWTKLSDTVLPDPSLNNMKISADNLLVNINDMADKNAGVYGMYMPSTDTSELVEVILYNAVETEKKYYYAKLGSDVVINVVINVEPAPVEGKVTWIKLPNKQLADTKYQRSEKNRRLTIKSLQSSDTGTYRCTVEFTVAGVKYTKSSSVIVKIEEQEL